jgi:hypothetical protein
MPTHLKYHKLCIRVNMETPQKIKSNNQINATHFHKYIYEGAEKIILKIFSVSLYFLP